MITVERYHDISCGHRVVGHEGKCRFLHGHNYRIHFTCTADTLDTVGRVIDFGVVKQRLCMWLEDKWDHRFIAWREDPVMLRLQWILQHDGEHAGKGRNVEAWESFDPSVVWVPFNPTAENLGLHLLNVVGPHQLEGTGVRLIRVRVEETRKCSATVDFQNE